MDRLPWIQIGPGKGGRDALEAFLQAEFALQRSEQRRRLAVHTLALLSVPVALSVYWPTLLSAGLRFWAITGWASVALLVVVLVIEEVGVRRQRNRLLEERQPRGRHGSNPG